MFIPNSQSSRIRFQTPSTSALFSTSSIMPDSQHVALGSCPGHLVWANWFVSEPRWEFGRLKTAAALICLCTVLFMCHLSISLGVYLPEKHGEQTYARCCAPAKEVSKVKWGGVDFSSLEFLCEHERCWGVRERKRKSGRERFCGSRFCRNTVF